MSDKKVTVILPIIIQHEWQKHMTEAAIKIMRCTTKIPYELIIVETQSMYFDEAEANEHQEYGWNKYLHFGEFESFTRDFNAAIEEATGDIIVHTANDIFVQDGWLEALLECFEIDDCGCATLSSKELKQPVMDKIVESVSCPVLMAFPNKYRFDEEFPNVCSDTDMIMRIYEDGKRMYRNYRVQYTHLHEQTYEGLYSQQEKAERGQKYMDLFRKRHEGSPLLMYNLLAQGVIV